MKIHIRQRLREHSWYTYVHIYTHIKNIYSLNTGQEIVLWWGNLSLPHKTRVFVTYSFLLCNKGRF